MSGQHSQHEHSELLLSPHEARRYDGSSVGGSPNPGARTSSQPRQQDGEEDGASYHQASPKQKMLTTFDANDEGRFSRTEGGSANWRDPSIEARTGSHMSEIEQEDAERLKQDAADEEEETVAARHEQELFDFHNKRTRGTFVSTTANTLCTMIGGGLLALPLACKHASVLWFLGILLLSGTLCTLACYSLVVCCDASGRYTFQGICTTALRCQFPSLKGKKKVIAKIVESFVWLNSLAVLIIYMKVIGDTMPPVITSILSNDISPGFDQAITNKWFWIGLSAFLFLFTALFKTLRDLLAVSVLGFLSMLFVSVVVISSFGIDANDPNSAVLLQEKRGNQTLDLYVPDQAQNLLPAFSIITISFTVQMNIPMLYFELGKKRSRRHMLGTSILSYIIATILFAAVGVCGYLNYAGEVENAHAEGNIMLNYADDYLPMSIGRCLVYVRFVCAFPIVLSVGRRSFAVVFLGQEQPHWQVRTILTFTVVVIAAVLGGLLPHGVGILVEYIGAIFGTSVALTIPALLYCFMFPVIRQSEPETPRFRQYAAVAVIAFGVLLSISSVVSTTLSLYE